MSSLRPLVVRWLANIRLSTLFSCVPVWDATSPLTIAAAVNRGANIAAPDAARLRGTRACGGPRTSTGTAVRKRGGRPIATRKPSGDSDVRWSSWGITAASRKKERYEHLPRRNSMPSERPPMARTPIQLQPMSPDSSPAPRVSKSQTSPPRNGCWWRGQACWSSPVDDKAPRQPVPSVGDKDKSSRSSHWPRGGAVAGAELWRGRNV